MQPGGFDLGQLMASAQRMQADMERAQASLAEARVTGSAGGGLVRAEVNGAGELLGLVIDPSVVDPADTETLADLVVAAVRDGVRAANDLTREAMGSVAGELMGGLTLPGMGDLPGLGAGDLPGTGGAIPPGLAGLPGLSSYGAISPAGFEDDFDEDDEFGDDDGADDDGADQDGAGGDAGDGAVADADEQGLEEEINEVVWPGSVGSAGGSVPAEAAANPTEGTPGDGSGAPDEPGASDGAPADDGTGRPGDADPGRG